MLFKFSCYFPIETPVRFRILVDSDDLLVDLAEAVVAGLRTHRRLDFSVHEIEIFKADIPMFPDGDLKLRALRWLHQQSTSNRIERTFQPIASLFPTDPRLERGVLNIIIADAETLELVECLGDPDAAYKRKIKKSLNRRFTRLPPSASPSDIVHSSDKQSFLYGGNEPPVHLGRPSGAPAVIFNPALALLQQNLESLESVQVSCSDVDRAAKYLRCTVMYYKDEAQRQNAIKELVDELLGKGEWGLTLTWADNIKPAGSWWHDLFPILVLELKNTLGLSGDALLQAIVDYSKVTGRKKYEPFREVCNFPIILIGATANRLEIAVAVCVGSVYVSKLLVLDLSLGFRASENIIQLARVFKALSICQADLRRYYNGVGSFVFHKQSCLYPSPTLNDPSKALPKLTYRKFLSRAGQATSSLVDLGNAITAMYIATLDDTDQEVLVKFTPRYNETAHSILDKAQLAPRIHFCERVIGDLYMVVMDHVDGRPIWNLQQDGMPIPTIVSRTVELAVHLLHERNIVFGDLREPNILYIASEDRVVLVDFDWASNEGEGRYPATLNPANDWAEDVAPYGHMYKAHDLWQVERLKALC